MASQPTPERDRSGTSPEIRKEYNSKDEAWWDDLEGTLTDAEMSPRNILEYFPAFIRRRDLPVMLARYELFKLIIDLPGCIAELGVQHGAGFFLWSKLMETFCPGDRSRMVYGFESFSGLQGFREEDGARTGFLSKVEGGMSGDQKMVEDLVDLHTRDNFLQGIPRCELIAGDIMDTLDEFLETHSGVRFSMLYLDMDLYEPTLYALEKLEPLVVSGGVIVLDEYAAMPWEGESRAVEEYFRRTGFTPVMKSFPWAQNPHGYYVKGG